MRAVTVAAVAVLTAGLASCVSRDPFVETTIPVKRSGNWRIEQQVDRVTGAPVSNAFVTTLNASNSHVDFPRPADF